MWLELFLGFVNSIKANLVAAYDSMALQHNVGLDEDVRNLSMRDYETSNCTNWIELFECG